MHSDAARNGGGRAFGAIVLSRQSGFPCRALQSAGCTDVKATSAARTSHELTVHALDYEVERTRRAQEAQQHTPRGLA
jgi:hypothetical protein